MKLNPSTASAKKSGAAKAWILQCPPGLAMTLKKEMQSIGAINRDHRLFIKRQRNHDLIFLNQLKDGVDLRRLRIAEQVMSCPVFGRYKVSQTQLNTLAAAISGDAPRRLVVQVAGRVFDRRDLLRWLTKELTARGAKLRDGTRKSDGTHASDDDGHDDGDEEIVSAGGDELWMFCIDENSCLSEKRTQSPGLSLTYAISHP